MISSKVWKEISRPASLSLFSTLNTVNKMIVREVLTNPELINDFDFFNDTKDTVSWLNGIGTPEAKVRSKKLQEADHAHWKKARNQE